MDAPPPPSLPVARAVDRELVLPCLLAGIALVEAGLAARVLVANLAGVEAVAVEALAAAQAAHVGFVLRADRGSVSALIGPVTP